MYILCFSSSRPSKKRERMTESGKFAGASLIPEQSSRRCSLGSNPRQKTTSEGVLSDKYFDRARIFLLARAEQLRT